MKQHAILCLCVAVLAALGVSCKKAESDNPAAPGPVSHSGRHSGNWEWQSPLPQGNDLNDVSFVNDTQGWAVGVNGTILHTTDGGNTWTSQPSGTTEWLTRVQFVDPDHGWALAGENTVTYWSFRDLQHAVLRTTDGGRHWSRTSLASDGLYDLHFRNASTGWMVGTAGSVWQTRDGGASWTLLSHRPDTYLAAVWFVSESRGYVGGWQRLPSSDTRTFLSTTTDGGSTWADSLYDYGNVVDISFQNDQNGWMAMHTGIVWRTSNGGASWSPAYYTSYYYVARMLAVDYQTAWMVSYAGGLRRTTNGGATWTEQAASNARAVCFAGTDRGWYVGNYGAIARSGNGGEEWDTQTVRLTSQFVYDLSFSDADYGLAASSDGSLHRTTDGGATWDSLFSVSPLSLNRVTFLDSLHALAIGGWYDPYQRQSAVVLTSADAGASWSQTMLGVSGSRWSLGFCDARHGWAVSDGGTILHTADGAETWEVQTVSQAYYELRGVAALSPQEAWICAASSYNGSNILHTTDAGRTWDFRVLTGVSTLSDIVFADEQNGWVAGGNGILLHTPDDGETWIVQPTGTTCQLRRIAFADRGTGIAVGDSGTVLISVDGGESWQPEEGVTVNDLYAIYFRDPDHGWVGGPGGTILRFLGTQIGF